MADQILTQEEIDALLSAMDRGDVDLDEEIEREAEVVPYNLTSQNVMLRDQFHALEEVYDKFANLLDHALSTSLQRSIDVEFVSAEMAKYGQFISAFSSPTSFHIFNMEPLIGSAVLAMEPGLVFSLIDCMFGGEGKPIACARDFTFIEQRMIRKIVQEVFSRLQQAWTIVYPITIILRKTESKPEFVHLSSPNDMIVSIVFLIRGKEFSGNIHLCIPYLMLEPIKEKLSSKYLREKDTQHTWSLQLRHLLRGTQVTLIAELGSAVHTVRDLLNLKINDVIQLDTGPEDLIRISVDHVPKFLGLPGTIKGNRAVEIAELLRNNGDSQ